MLLSFCLFLMEHILKQLGLSDGVGTFIIVGLDPLLIRNIFREVHPAKMIAMSDTTDEILVKETGLVVIHRLTTMRGLQGPIVISLIGQDYDTTFGLFKKIEEYEESIHFITDVEIPSARRNFSDGS